MKRPTIEELQARIAELERRIAVLEAQPREHHYHYHPPVYVPPAQTQPLLPTSPLPPTIGDPVAPPFFRITCSDPLPWDTSTVTWTNRGESLC